MSAFTKTVEAKPHSPLYTMHKYFARRPWNVFSELIKHYTSPGQIVLDPFCGGGVTVIESLRLGRKAIGVDINPMATYVTEMEAKHLNLELFESSLAKLRNALGSELDSLYATTCQKCGSRASAEWIEWDEQRRRMVRLRYSCPICKETCEKTPSRLDVKLARKIESSLDSAVNERGLWFPRTRIPEGDKTNSLLAQGLKYFHELFTKRNLLALALLKAEIERLPGNEAKEFLEFAFSSSLKWASRMSHLRGEIVEGWAIHAYWIYPKSLEINVWRTFQRRATAITRGKRYSNDHLRYHYRIGNDFDDLSKGATCIIWNRSSAHLPLPDESVDAIITDPPYGGNVNYAELADYWFIWRSGGKTINKRDEIIINRTQGKGLNQYEQMLYSVLAECNRVLKNGRCLVSTFNSRDVRIVASFVIAASRAGFRLHPDGVVYQEPIRAYTTTFHAMQIGAFVGDFVFTFVKQAETPYGVKHTVLSVADFESELTGALEQAARRRLTEPQVRKRVYSVLIPFLGAHAYNDLDVCREAVNFLETKMKERRAYFKQLREKVTKTRRQKFLRMKASEEHH